jgi:hypothetical protein
MKLEEFMNKNEPRKKSSVFDEYFKDIKTLLDLNYSQKQVIEYLKSNSKNKSGLTEANLSIYLAKIKKENKFEKVKDKIVDKNSKEIVIEDKIKPNQNEEKAKAYDEIKNYCMALRKKHLSEDEQKEVKSITSLIDFFVEKAISKDIIKKSSENNTYITPNESNEEDNSISIYSKIAKIRENNSLG